MLRFHQKKTFRRVLYSKGAVVVLGIALLFGFRATWGVYQKEREARANVVDAREELTELQDRERFLREEIARLSTERGVEEEIRKKFPVAKEGEEVAIIVDAPLAEVEEIVEENPSFFKRILNFVNGE